jgi:hypothetical protein
MDLINIERMRCKNMYNYKFDKKYKNALDNFMNELDNFLVGKWKSDDHEQGEYKSQWNLEADDIIIISFGDSNTRPEYKDQLTIYIKEKNNTLTITEINSLEVDTKNKVLNENKLFDRAYSKDILKFIEHQIIGKTDDELNQEEILKLEKELQKQEDNIKRIKQHLIEEEEKAFNIISKIAELR